MNTATVSLRADRPKLKTPAGTLVQRVGAGMRKLWSLSGRVSLPAEIRSTNAGHLPRGMVLSLDQADGVAFLELKRGTVWITGTPARGDTILQAGEKHDFGNSWPYVIEALSDADFIAGSRAHSN